MSAVYFDTVRATKITLRAQVEQLMAEPQLLEVVQFAYFEEYSYPHLRWSSPVRLILAASLSLVLLFANAGSSRTAISEESGLICTLTGKKIEACCCQEKDGALYCPLAKQTIDHCCCHSASTK
jgi:hypothetical protein